MLGQQEEQRFEGEERREEHRFEEERRHEQREERRFEDERRHEERDERRFERECPPRARLHRRTFLCICTGWKLEGWSGLTDDTTFLRCEHAAASSAMYSGEADCGVNGHD